MSKFSEKDIEERDKERAELIEFVEGHIKRAEYQAWEAKMTGATIMAPGNLSTYYQHQADRFRAILAILRREK